MSHARDNIGFSLEPYQNVIFDIGNVIVSCNNEGIIKKALGNTDRLDFYNKHLFTSEELCRGEIDEEEFVLNLSRASNTDPKEIEIVIATIKESLVPITDSVILLKNLHEMGMNLYALTNMSKEIFAYIKAKYDFWNYFKDITVSAHIHLIKPELAIYQYVLDKNELDSSKTIFLDDVEKNVKAGQELGITGIVFIDAKQCIEDLAKLVGLRPESERRGLDTSPSAKYAQGI